VVVSIEDNLNPYRLPAFWIIEKDDI